MVNFLNTLLVNRSRTWLVHNEWGWYADRCDGGEGNGKQFNKKIIESKLQFLLIKIFSKKWVSKPFLQVFQYQITVCDSLYAHSLLVTVLEISCSWRFCLSTSVWWKYLSLFCKMFFASHWHPFPSFIQCYHGHMYNFSHCVVPKYSNLAYLLNPNRKQFWLISTF